MSDIPVELVVDDAGALTKVIVTEGHGGLPPQGAEVEVHYTGRLLDGTVFDSSRNRNDTFKFKLGKGQVIKGWDVGVATMKQGERATFTIRSDYAYGESGSGASIPPNATLVFDVELISFETRQKVTADAQVVKEVLQAGAGFQNPKPGATVTLNLVGRVAGGEEFLKQQDLQFELGDVEAIPQAVDEALRKMVKGEKSLIIAKPGSGPTYGYSAAQAQKLGFPAAVAAGDAALEWEVELVSFEGGSETWSMNLEQKLDFANRLKEQGNKAFGLQLLARACKRYQEAIDLFQYEREAGADVNQVRVVCHANRATALFRNKDFPQAKKACDEALKIDPRNFKCLALRGQLLANDGLLQPALADLQLAFEIDAKNATVNKFLDAVKKRIAAAEAKQRKAMQKFFGKPGARLVSEEELAAAKKKTFDDDFMSDDDSDEEIDSHDGDNDKQEEEAAAEPAGDESKEQ